MTTLVNAYGKLSPRVRFAAKTVVIAVVTYLYQDLGDGDIDDWDALLDAAKIAGTYALLGLLTPLEPFVGPEFSKPDQVVVPSPPAVAED